MLALETARERLLSALVALPAEPVPVAAADGRVAAADVASPRDLPPFDNSAMDGYAVRAADTATV
ncbi:MAG: molybdopterin molybdenumtransferase MoeA, partial [Deltaproteobacteria bacterium]